jgi:hypothetical protein
VEVAWRLLELLAYDVGDYLCPEDGMQLWLTMLMTKEQGRASACCALQIALQGSLGQTMERKKEMINQRSLSLLHLKRLWFLCLQLKVPHWLSVYSISFILLHHSR